MFWRSSLAGERLKEEVLAQTHAESCATVREALIALARQGYVVRIPRFGARIAELTRHDLYYLFELHAALLAVAAGRFARRAEPTDDRTLEAMVAELEAAAAVLRGAVAGYMAKFPPLLQQNGQADVQRAAFSRAGLDLEIEDER